MTAGSYKGAGYKYASSIFHAKISGGIWECDMYEQKSYIPTETQPFERRNNKSFSWVGGIINNYTKGSDIRTFKKITLQIWDVVFGVGTRIIVWGR